MSQLKFPETDVAALRASIAVRYQKDPAMVPMLLDAELKRREDEEAFLARVNTQLAVLDAEIEVATKHAAQEQKSRDSLINQAYERLSLLRAADAAQRDKVHTRLFALNGKRAALTQPAFQMIERRQAEVELRDLASSSVKEALQNLSPPPKQYQHLQDQPIA
jgi:hypothetical protein